MTSKNSLKQAYEHGNNLPNYSQDVFNRDLHLSIILSWKIFT